MMAGADFIKTSTGKEGVNATLPVGLVMVRAIREYHERDRLPGRLQAGRRHRAPPRTRCNWLIADEGGAGQRLAASRDLFRIGASSLLTDIERQLEHYVTGRYSADHRHAQP